MSQQIANIHDAFFKALMSRKEYARTFLLEHLPSEVTALLAPDPPELRSGSFVDEELAQHHSDILFQIRLVTGNDALAYVLVEHKSSRDPETPLQLVRYVARVLVREYRNTGLPLPLVIPVVVHHGSDGWKHSAQFIDLFGKVPDSLRPYLVSFRHALVDLVSIADGALSKDARLSAYLRMLKHARDKSLPDHLNFILIPELGDVDLEIIIHYINKGPVPVSPEKIRDVLLHQLGPHRQETIMGHISHEFEAKGFAKGEANALILLLKKRFDTVPQPLQERIFASDVATIEAWFDQALDGKDLQSIFEPTPCKGPSAHSS